MMSGILVKLDTAPVRPQNTSQVSSPDGFCPCDFRCEFEEKVFASSEQENKDFSDFLFKKVSPVDTITFKILKNGDEVATISDNSYGIFYSSFPVQPLYTGFIADWSQIFASFSGGSFQIRAETVILGVAATIDSRYFRLNSFDPLEASDTVKIETLQSGYLLNSDLDFRGLLPGGWPTYIRIKGRFGRMSPTFERDVYLNGSYTDVQNRDEVMRQYTLKAFKLPESIFERLTTRDFLANEIFISSYHLLDERPYTKIPVVLENINGNPTFDDLGNTYSEIVFSDRQKNLIKTNTR